MKDREKTGQAAIDRLDDLKDTEKTTQATIDRVGDVSTGRI